MTKIYYKIVTLIVSLLVWFGGVLPYLISAKDDLLVATGFVVTLIIIPLFVVFGIGIVKDLIKVTEDKLKQNDLLNNKKKES